MGVGVGGGGRFGADNHDLPSVKIIQCWRNNVRITL